jgi:predicted protein tyrosine phosphatase
MSERKILFVCTGNIDRSPTAERLFKNVKGFNAKSAGISTSAVTPITEELINWADEIYVMEYKHKQAVLTLAPSVEEKVKVLGIPDIYCRDDQNLKQVIKEKMKPFIEL